MSVVTRDYRVRVAQVFASEVTGNVEFIFGLDRLKEPPVISGNIVNTVSGTSETRVSIVPVVDQAGELSAAFTNAGRWNIIGRLIDFQYSDNGGSSWTTYGAGRITGIDENTGPGVFNIEVSDESWKVRNGELFTVADTTTIWPSGVKAPWRGFDPPLPARGSIRDSTNAPSGLWLLDLTTFNADTPFGTGAELTSTIINYISSDMVEEPSKDMTSEFGATNNFKHVRVHYAGTDYEVVTFGDLKGDDFLKYLKEPRIGQINGRGLFFSIAAWVRSATAPPLLGEAYIHAPTAPPSRTYPLHVGMADASHEWGTSSGWIHIADLTRRVWTKLGVSFDNDSLNTAQADKSLMVVAPRIIGPISDPEQWLQEKILGPNQQVALRDNQGRRKLVDLRLPQAGEHGLPVDFDPDTLPVLDPSNTNEHTWKLVGQDLINRLVFKYQGMRMAPFAETHGNFIRRAINFPNWEDPDLDNLIVEDKELDPFDGDTVVSAGIRTQEIDLSSMVGPTADIWRKTKLIESGEGAMVSSAAPVLAKDLFDMMQDGAVRGSIEVQRTLAETLTEGDLVTLDQSALQATNPETGARTGHRIVRVLTITRHPTHAVLEYIDIGPRLQPLGPPTVSIIQNTDDPNLVTVTVTNIPSGALANIEVGFSPNSVAPTTWTERRAGLSNGQSVNIFHGLGSGWMHARARSVAPNRVRSPWAYDSVQLATRPIISELIMELRDGVPHIFGTPNGAANGVRIQYAVHEEDEEPEFEEEIFHFSTAGLTAAGGLVLSTVDVPFDMEVTALLTPYTNWTVFGGGVASGTAGPEVSIRAARGPLPPETPWGTLTAAYIADENFVEFFASGNQYAKSFKWAIRLGEPPIAPEDEDNEVEGEFNDTWGFIEVEDVENPTEVPVFVAVWFYPEEEYEGDRGPRVLARAGGQPLVVMPKISFEVDEQLNTGRLRAIIIDPQERIENSAYKVYAPGNSPTGRPDFTGVPSNGWTTPFPTYPTWVTVSLFAKHFSKIAAAFLIRGEDGESDWKVYPPFIYDADDQATIIDISARYTSTGQLIAEVTGDTDTWAGYVTAALGTSPPDPTFSSPSWSGMRGSVNTGLVVPYGRDVFIKARGRNFNSQLGAVMEVKYTRGDTIWIKPHIRFSAARSGDFINIDMSISDKTRAVTSIQYRERPATVSGGSNLGPWTNWTGGIGTIGFSEFLNRTRMMPVDAGLLGEFSFAVEYRDEDGIIRRVTDTFIPGNIKAETAIIHFSASLFRQSSGSSGMVLGQSQDSISLASTTGSGIFKAPMTFPPRVLLTWVWVWMRRDNSSETVVLNSRRYFPNGNFSGNLGGPLSAPGTSGWQLVQGALNEPVNTSYSYAADIGLFSNGSNSVAPAFARLSFEYDRGAYTFVY